MWCESKRWGLAAAQLVGMPSEGIQPVGIHNQRQGAIRDNGARELLGFWMRGETRPDGQNTLVPCQLNEPAVFKAAQADAAGLRSLQRRRHHLRHPGGTEWDNLVRAMHGRNSRPVPQ